LLGWEKVPRGLRRRWTSKTITGATDLEKRNQHTRGRAQLSFASQVAELDIEKRLQKDLGPTTLALGQRGKKDQITWDRGATKNPNETAKKAKERNKL